jgi:hypothetical protein
MIGSVRRRHHSVLVGSTWGAVVATGADDTRTVLAIVALLAVVGVGLVMLAMWLFRVTRPDRELLAPLEVMGDRKWRRGDPVWQRRRLDEVRPVDAAPFSPATAPPAIDESYDVGPTAPGFEDLSDRDDVAVIEEVEVVEDVAVIVEPPEADDDEDATVQIDAPADRETSTEADGAPDVEGEPPADADEAVDVDAAVDAAVDEAVDVDDTIDGAALLAASSSLSDDVSSTPPLGIRSEDFVAAGPSADPDATLADLGAATEEHSEE